MLSWGWTLSLYCFLFWWFATNAAIAEIAAIKAEIAATASDNSCIWSQIKAGIDYPSIPVNFHIGLNVIEEDSSDFSKIKLFWKSLSCHGRTTCFYWCPFCLYQFLVLHPAFFDIFSAFDSCIGGLLRIVRNTPCAPNHNDAGNAVFFAQNLYTAHRNSPSFGCFFNWKILHEKPPSNCSSIILWVHYKRISE